MKMDAVIYALQKMKILMRKIELEQGSQEWLTWRKGLITATEASSIMGVNPYCSQYKSWQRKTGMIPEQAETEPMRRGKRDEPIARAMFNELYGMQMEPCCIESTTYNFLGASLDGLSPCGKYLLEIKSQQHSYSKEKFDMHFTQMQHQMLCSDGQIEKGYYVSYWQGEILVEEVLPDPTWMKKYLPQAQEYWRCVIFYEPPEMQPCDYRNMECDSYWNEQAAKYIRLCNEIKALEEVKEKHRKELISLSGELNCFGNGVKVFRKIIKGRIDYDAIPQLKEIDTQNYRKPTTISWTISLDQKQVN